VIFLFKLAIKHPTFFGKKITTTLDNNLGNKMRGLFQDPTTQVEKRQFYIQHLLFSEKFREVSFLHLCKILFIILKCRGLIRTLLLLFPLPNNEATPELHLLKRMDVIRILFRQRAIFLNHIIARMKIDYPRPEDLLHFPVVNEVMRFDLNYLESHKGEKVIYFNLQNGKPSIFGCNNPTKIPKRELFFHKLMLWDSRGVANFLLRAQMQDVSRAYLNLVYPQFRLGEDDFKSVPVRVIEGYDQILDFDSSASIQSRCQRLKTVQIWHQRFIISKDEFLIHDSTSHPEQEFVAGQWQFIKSFEKSQNMCLIKNVFGETKYLESGIFLSGRCDENWFHFILDTVPRVLFVNDIPDDVPLLIRSDIPENSKAVLATISDRKIIEIETNEVLEVENLYVVPGRSSVFDSTPPKGTPIVEFSPQVLGMIRFLLLKAQDKLDRDSRIELPFHTIALSRYSSTRNLQNELTVNSVLEELGFTICELNLGFFKKQIKIFSHAKIIVAPGGAALANIIFMPVGSVVVVLRSRRNSDLNLWVKLANAMGVQCIEVTGIPTYFGPGKLRRMHSDFYISPRKLRKVLASVTASIT
jgi:hypothetical protein